MLKTPLPLGHINQSKRGLQNTPLSKTVASRCACPRYQGSTPDVIPWEWTGGSAQLQMMRSSAQFGGMDEFTGERKKKTCHFSFFSRLKSLSFRVQEGIVALTLFFGRRVAACQRQLHMGSFTLHAASGFRGKLFLFLDHLPL